jgi:hypothetical protein
MKVFYILLASLSLLMAGDWIGGGLAAKDRGTTEAIEPKVRLAQSSSDDETVWPAGQLRRIQERLISDEAVFRKIRALQDDPDIQAVLSDPALMEALEAGDLNSVISDPNFIRLIENPAIQEIMNAVR